MRRASWSGCHSWGNEGPAGVCRCPPTAPRSARSTHRATSWNRRRPGTPTATNVGTRPQNWSWAVRSQTPTWVIAKWHARWVVPGTRNYAARAPLLRAWERGVGASHRDPGGLLAARDDLGSSNTLDSHLGLWGPVPPAGPKFLSGASPGMRFYHHRPGSPATSTNWQNHTCRFRPVPQPSSCPAGPGLSPQESPSRLRRGATPPPDFTVPAPPPDRTR